MDKLRTKQLLTGAGLATPAYRVLRDGEDFGAVCATLGLPLMVKPASEGSSLGLTKVTRPDELGAAYRDAARYDCDVFAEAWVTGCEYTAAVLQGEVLPIIRIDAANTFYDYEAKYFSDKTAYVCPCGLAAADERDYAALALLAFEFVGGSGWGRVDFMLNDAGEPLILEINTVPGMTSHSLVPMAARQAGIEFDELVWRILETSCAARSGQAQTREVAGAG
jgi:D-alanine-D-alanine ligase